MLRPILPIFAALCLVGCRPDAPTEPETIWDVSATHLTRDYPTAQSYAGYMVRVRIAKGYAVAGHEIHVYGYVRGSPPLVVFRCRESPPTEGQRLIITGRCLPPARDGRWRTVLADFCLTVTDCTVTQSPDP